MRPERWGSNLMPEIWIPIRGWEGLYEVSDEGRVRSYDRVVGTSGFKRRIRGRVLAPVPRQGYCTVSLKDGKRIRIESINRLMLLSFKFHDECEKLDSCHENGVRTDNRLRNLRWDTRKGNLLDMDVHNTRIKGDTHPASRLTGEQVRYIRASNETDREMAQRFGVKQQVVYCARVRRTWRHI